MAEAVSEEDIAKGLVDEHVDYLRRRKLCMHLWRKTQQTLFWGDVFLGVQLLGVLGNEA